MKMACIDTIFDRALLCAFTLFTNLLVNSLNIIHHITTQRKRHSQIYIYIYT